MDKYVECIKCGSRMCRVYECSNPEMADMGFQLDRVDGKLPPHSHAVCENCNRMWLVFK